MEAAGAGLLLGGAGCNECAADFHRLPFGQADAAGHGRQDALRPYTPKKVKPLAVERTRVGSTGFPSEPAGICSDIMRHRSRTAMSLIGIVGSMILIIGSLGMGDTMDAFLALYYDGATNYASRIYLTGGCHTAAAQCGG